MNSVESTGYVEFIEDICKNDSCIQTCFLLCERQACCPSTKKGQVTECIFKLTPNSCFSDLSDSINSLTSLDSMKVLQFKKTPV